MTPRTTAANLTSQPARRLWALGSVLLIGAAAAAFSVSALAGGHRGHHGENGSKGAYHSTVCIHEMHISHVRHLDRLRGDAKLTDAQRTQIRDIQSKAYADLKALHPRGHMPMGHGLSLLGEVKPDAAAAEKARQEMLVLHDKASQRMLKAQLDIANVLTPAQRAQIAATLKARQERMDKRMKDRQASPAASQPAAAASAQR